MLFTATGHTFAIYMPYQPRNVPSTYAQVFLYAHIMGGCQYEESRNLMHVFRESQPCTMQPGEACPALWSSCCYLMLMCTLRTRLSLLALIMVVFCNSMTAMSAALGDPCLYCVNLMGICITCRLCWCPRHHAVSGSLAFSVYTVSPAALLSLLLLCGTRK